MATMSILGLYNYDPTIFDGLSLPTAADITAEAEKVSDPWIPKKADFIAYLMMQASELELLYASAPVMSTMITVWSAAHRNEWVQLYNTMLYKYNPIWNKDGTYKEVRTPDLTTRDDGSSQTSSTADTKNNVTGYDSNNYSPNTQQITTGSANGTAGNTRKETGTETIVRTESGNIGVTMTQEMIRQQREIVEFNLYDYIARQFVKQFCLQIY